MVALKVPPPARTHEPYWVVSNSRNGTLAKSPGSEMLKVPSLWKDATAGRVAPGRPMTDRSRARYQVPYNWARWGSAARADHPPSTTIAVDKATAFQLGLVIAVMLP